MPLPLVFENQGYHTISLSYNTTSGWTGISTSLFIETKKVQLARFIVLPAGTNSTESGQYPESIMPSASLRLAAKRGNNGVVT